MPPAKTSETTKQNSILVRSIVAAVKIQFPDETALRYLSAVFAKGLSELPKMEIGHVLRLHEAMSEMDFLSEEAKAFRAGVLKQLGKMQNLSEYSRRRVATPPAKGGN